MTPRLVSVTTCPCGARVDLYEDAERPHAGLFGQCKICGEWTRKPNESRVCAGDVFRVPVRPPGA